MTATWMQLLMIWSIFWWGYSAAQLLVPEDGDTLFYANERAHHRVLQVLLWACMILTAPLWCPVFELVNSDT